MFYTCLQKESQAECPYSLAEGTRTPVSLNFDTLVFTFTVLIGAFDIHLSCVMYVTTVQLDYEIKCAKESYICKITKESYLNSLRNHSYIYI